jgi:hypothetical protein
MEITIVLSAIAFVLSILLVIVPIALKNWADYVHISDYSHSKQFRNKVLTSFAVGGLSQLYFMYSTYQLLSNNLFGFELWATQVGYVFSIIGSISLITITVVDYHRWSGTHNMLMRSQVISSVSAAGFMSLGLLQFSVIPLLMFGTSILGFIYTFLIYPRKRNGKHIYAAELNYLFTSAAWTFSVLVTLGSGIISL